MERLPKLFNRCPSCKSLEITLQRLTEGGWREFCGACNFVTNYVEFTCKHCNPDIFALCPVNNCNPPGRPKQKLCLEP